MIPDSFFPFSYFSLAHEADILLSTNLNAQNGHLATQDAKAAMQLYLKYKVSYDRIAGRTYILIAF